MLCPICCEEIHREEVLVNRTTSPEEDDRWETLPVCHKCDEVFPDYNEMDEMGDEYGI